MVQSLSYLWRLLATALAFGLFGLGGLVLRLVVFPLQSLWPGDPGWRRARARRTISRMFWLFTQFMYRSGILTFTVEGGERLGRPGQLIIANHPSLIDVVLLIACIRDANCVVKQSLFHNPFTRGPVRAAGYLSNGSAEILDDAEAALRRGKTLVVFPEGTRTTPGTMPSFHRGGAAIALRGAQMITPVVITVDPPTLTKGEPWYRIPKCRVHFQLCVGDDIDPGQFAALGLPPVASRKLNQHLHDYFRQQLETV